MPTFSPTIAVVAIQTMHELGAVLRRNRWEASVYRAALNDKAGNNAMPGRAAVKAQVRQVQKFSADMSLRKMGEKIDLNVAKEVTRRTR